MLSRATGFSAHHGIGEGLLINYMAVFTQHGYLTLSCLVGVELLLFIYYLRSIYFQREFETAGENGVGVVYGRLPETRHL